MPLGVYASFFTLSNSALFDLAVLSEDLFLLVCLGFLLSEVSSIKDFNVSSKPIVNHQTILLNSRRCDIPLALSLISCKSIISSGYLKKSLYSKNTIPIKLLLQP